jgi:hypothetical protein
MVGIAVAALASAATSPPPTPSPDVSAQTVHSLNLTADNPVAWVEVGADEDPSLIAADARTTIRVQTQYADPGVYLIGEQVGAPGQRSDGIGYGGYTVSCVSGEPCDARIRLTAVLFDPGIASVDVGYTAAAESWFPPNTGPVPAAKVALDVGEAQTRTAAAFGMVATEPAEIRVGAGVPLAVRTIHLSMPAGPPAATVVEPGALVSVRQPGERPPFESDVEVHYRTGTGDRMRQDQDALRSLFAECEPGTPCSVDLTLEVYWNGGTAADEASREWIFVAWPGVGAEQPAPAIAIDEPVATDVRWDRPALNASTTGQARASRTQSGRMDVNGALDLSGVPQRLGEIDGLARLVIRASLASDTDPDTVAHFSVQGTPISATLGGGKTTTIYSKAMRLVCQARTICPVSFSAGAGIGSDGPEATIDWAADLEFAPLGADELPADAKLVIGSPSPGP